MSDVLLLSGGVDSAVVLADLVHGGLYPLCLCIDYGQQSAYREVQAAAMLSTHYACKFEMIPLPGIWKDAPLVTGEAVDSWERAEVPFRNPLLISVAVARAMRGSRNEKGRVATGIQPAPPGYTPYADTSSAFIHSMENLIWDASGGRVRFMCPLVRFRNKTEVIKRGKELGVPWQYTHSCFFPTPCGQCPTCKQRIGAFAKAGIEDPVTVAV